MRVPSSDSPAPWVDRLKTLLGAAIGAACLWLAFRRVPVAEVWRSVATVRVVPVALAVATIVLATALRAWRWRLLFPLGDREVGFGRLWPILLVGHMINILLPARAGDVARLYLVERTERRAVAETLGTMAVEKALDGVVFLAMLWALAMWADLPGSLSRAGDVVSLTLGIALLSVALVVLFGDRALGAIARSAALPDRLKRLLLERWLTPLVEGFAGRRRVGALLSALALSFCVWGAAWLANYFCLTALAIDRAALAALLVLVVLQLGTAVPMSPGGLGVFEYLCVLALGILAVPRSVAVSFGVLLHVVAYLPPVLLGAAIIGLKILPWAKDAGRIWKPGLGTGDSRLRQGSGGLAEARRAKAAGMGTRDPEPGTPNPERASRKPEVASREPASSRVSVVVPCLNEAEHIEQLLEAVRLQDEPPFDVVVVDGGSTDDTLTIVERYRAQHPELRVLTIAQPHWAIPVSLNAGIRAAAGHIIVRLDAHSRPRLDYLRRLVGLLRASGAGVAGGRWEIEPGSPTAVGRAIAWAAQHPLGAGDAAYRLSPRGPSPVSVDTVPFGCFEKSLWESLGGYNEDLLTNEDYEFNYRVRRQGRDVLLDPSVVSVYVARGSLGALARQYFRYGWWKLAMLKRHPRSLRWRQAVPMLFVTGVGALAVGAFWSTSFLWGLAALLIPYVAVVGAVSTRIAHRTHAWRTLPVLPAVFVVIHFAWGSGALANGLTLGRWPRWR